MVSLTPQPPSSLLHAGARQRRSLGELEAITTAIVCVATLTRPQRIWLNLAQVADPIDFASQYDEWKQLIGADSNWRERAGFDGRIWPDAEAIQTAAETLAKGTFGLIAAKLNGAHSSAKAFVNGLGTWQGRSPTGEELRGLTSHVRALENFLFENPIAQHLGPTWAGLDTPFDDIAAGSKVGQFLRNALLPLPHGPTIISHLETLDAASLDELGLLDRAAKDFRKLSVEFRDSISNLNLREQLLDTLNHQVRLRKRALAVDPDRLLAAINCPLLEISAR